MFQKIKKFFAIITIIVLLPYIITIFVTSGTVTTSSEPDDFENLLKEYCIQKLAEEVSSDYEEEMLKVQAIIVRTTVYKEVEEQGRAFTETEGFGVKKDLDSLWYRKLKNAWEETDGQVVMYKDSLALLPFHQVSNGKTRNGEEVLGSEDYPYLKSLECPSDVEAENQMESQFIDITDVEVTETDSAGYVLNVKIGEEACSGESFRETYGLASSCFELQSFEDKTRVITKGVGHGLGLSQYTANEMAKEGKTYEEILQFFFAGTEIKEVAEILWNLE